MSGRYTRESQTDVVLALLREHGTVSAHDLTYRFGITRAAARIWDLKQAGHTIETIRRYVAALDTCAPSPTSQVA